MENVFFGLLTIIICLTGFFVAFKLHVAQKNVFTILALIVLCGLLLRLFVSADMYLHAWDERYHALVSKNLIFNPLHPTLYSNPVLPYDYKDWTANHIWVHKQPFPLWTMALSMSLFGINEIALRLPSILFSTVGIFLTFYIAKYFFCNRIGLFAAFLYAIHGLIIELVSGRVATDHVDVFFLFFIQLAIFFSIKFFQSKKYMFNILCGICVGVAILTKWLPALIVLPLWILIGLYSKQFNIKQFIIDFWVLCFCVVLIALPWQLYIHTKFPMESAWESSFNIKHFTEALENHQTPFYYHFDTLRIVYGELVYLPILWFLYITLKNKFRFHRLLFIVWILIPFIFFTIAKTRMQAYTLFTAPAIFIITAIFFDYLLRYRNRFRFKKIISVILFLLIALPIRYSLERIKPFENRDRNPLWASELKELTIHFNNQKVILFNMDYPIEAMFYTNFVAYKGIPDSIILNQLTKQGYHVYIRSDITTKKSIPYENAILLEHYNTYYSRYN